jgi:hypothetical protein
MFRSVAIAVIMTISLLPPSQAQQRQVLNSDRQGDYYSGSIKLANGSKTLIPYWTARIQTSKLNCRVEPGASKLVLMQFKPGEVIPADPGTDKFGEAIVRDTQGSPWLRVKMLDNQGIARSSCFVRANKQYIEPSNKQI